MEVANELILIGRFNMNVQLADDKLQKAFKQDPNSSVARWTYAILQEQLQQFEAAESYYKKVIAIDANDSRGQYSYASFLCRNKRYQEADKHFDITLSNPLYSAREAASLNAGVCAMEIPDYQSAQKYFTEVIRLNTKNRVALYQLAKSHFLQDDFGLVSQHTAHGKVELVTDQATSTPAKAQSEDERIGEKLRQARESALYSVAYVAGQTHLQEKVILALENDQFDQLPNDVFIKGYIRSYAKLLELDPKELLSSYSSDRGLETETVVPQVKKIKKLSSSGADPLVIWSSVTVVMILAGLLMTWWLYQDDSNPVELASVAERFDDEYLSESSEAQQPADTAHNVGLGDIDPKNVSAEQNAMPEVRQEDQIIPQQQAQVAPKIIEAPISGGEIDKVRITVKYTQESWTEIFDARKRRLLHGLIKPGAMRVISGQAPFNVFLGNSPGVQLEINGKPFDHSVYMRRNNTARFLIDDSNS